MNINKKYAVFGVAAVIAVAGIIYFGTSANQQASVAALNLKAASDTTNTALTDIGPITTNPNDPSWIKLCRDKKPHIQVLSPNGGEVYQVGQQITIKWRSCNLQGNIAEINLISANGWGGGSGGVTFDKNFMNDGTETVALFDMYTFTSANAVFGKNYKIELVAGPTGEIRDTSNNLFTINGTTGITVSGYQSGSTVTTDNSGHNISASWPFSFRITATGGDFYVPKNLGRGTTPTQAGLVYSVEDGAGVPTTTAGSTASSLNSNATTVNNYYRISNGQTETFTGTINATRGSDNPDFYRLQFNGVGYDTDQTGILNWYPIAPLNNYQTNYVHLD